MGNKIKAALLRFFSGRYARNDAVNLTILLAMLLLAIVNLFVKNQTASLLLSFVSFLLLVWATSRLLSRSVWKRTEENRRYTAFLTRIRNWFVLQKNRFRDRKTHVYRKCPKCGAVLRLPKKSGTHTVRCPGCSERFEVRVR